jgi:preprotein translocase subunit SecA
MDELREGIGLRSYGQRDPLVEYRNEAFLNFEEMVKRIREESVEVLFKIQPLKPAIFKGVFSNINQELMHPELGQFQSKPSLVASDSSVQKSDLSKGSNYTFEKRFPKVGRNDPCPCGKIDPHTGKPIKFKKCHGRNL